MDADIAKTLSGPTKEERQQLAKSEFDLFIASHPSRQQLKRFMQERANGYYMQAAAPRRVRRRAAIQLAKRMQAKGLKGEIN